ncbi:hypothetical protein CgunFtcFv8_016756 [Champsocephalus gunnari]|uniref:Uncharacterized protein n=1 Tax=Champsocephalus gunnari TaxID=52237 RepID=A0AAN8HAR7_CHAGU|nr:hypothetical protein CgunFtcFv8_016756 [Champsocephalus gunnari]
MWLLLHPGFISTKHRATLRSKHGVQWSMGLDVTLSTAVSLLSSFKIRMVIQRLLLCLPGAPGRAHV